MDDSFLRRDIEEEIGAEIERQRQNLPPDRGIRQSAEKKIATNPEERDNQRLAECVGGPIAVPEERKGCLGPGGRQGLDTL